MKSQSRKRWLHVYWKYKLGCLVRVVVDSLPCGIWAKWPLEKRTPVYNINIVVWKHNLSLETKTVNGLKFLIAIHLFLNLSDENNSVFLIYLRCSCIIFWSVNPWLKWNEKLRLENGIYCKEHLFFNDFLDEFLMTNVVRKLYPLTYFESDSESIISASSTSG